ncbi:MAG: TatD family hydrolase, partial [Candidatus Eremiobacteraeota bacterium]|nr:TatD family hydrolase [Candidatus Eremiobacteraeota bacterium]
THCHVHDAAFDADRAEAIARSAAAGVTRLLTVGCDLADSARAIDVAQRYGLWSSVGIHPHEAKDAADDVSATLAPLLERSSVVAIGETGLDYYYDHSPRAVQQRVFRAQLRIARERGLPLIFHQRDAFDDFCTILREESAPGMRGVVHCFTGDTEQAKRLTADFGFLLGIGGIVTFANAHGLREAVRAVGADAIVLETDCPYLAPVPMRGRRNEPAFVSYVAGKVAEILGIGIAELTAATDRNAGALFGR